MRDDQRDFVAPVTRYLALCAYDDGPWHPLLLLAGGRAVGFAMEAVDPDDGSYWIGGFLVDTSEQGRGVGRAALAAMLDRGRARGCATAALSYQPANVVARALYASCGFVETGETEGDEIVARVAMSLA